MIVKEIIVVEGRDDTAAIKRAVDANTIETHGFGIRKETWDLIEKAYNEKGIIIFTDPDFAGNEILECKYDKITFDGFERPEERDYVYDDGYSQDELDAMYRDAFEDDPDAQWNIW